MEDGDEIDVFEEVVGGAGPVEEDYEEIASQSSWSEIADTDECKFPEEESRPSEPQTTPTEIIKIRPYLPIRQKPDTKDYKNDNKDKNTHSMVQKDALDKLSRVNTEPFFVRYPGTMAVLESHPDFRKKSSCVHLRQYGHTTKIYFSGWHTPPSHVFRHYASAQGQDIELLKFYGMRPETGPLDENETPSKVRSFSHYT